MPLDKFIFNCMYAHHFQINVIKFISIYLQTIDGIIYKVIMNRTHLGSGVKDDSLWQAWWRDLAVMTSRRYDVPIRKVGLRFIGTLGVEMQGCRKDGGTRRGSSSSRR